MLRATDYLNHREQTLHIGPKDPGSDAKGLPSVRTPPRTDPPSATSGNTPRKGGHGPRHTTPAP